MNLCQLVIQYFDKILHIARFPEPEQKLLCRRLFRIWLIRSATANFPLLSQSQQDRYIAIVTGLEAHTESVLDDFMALSQEIESTPQSLTQFKENMLLSAQGIVSELIEETSHHVSQDTIQELHHDFEVIKHMQLA